MTGLALFRSALLACFATLTIVPALSQTVTVSPTTLSFGNQAQGTSSSVHNVRLKNGQSSAITITSISTNLADYSQTNSCPISPATLAAGATCTISITFTPSAQGSRNATLTVVDTGLSSPQLVTLTGTGTPAILESIAITPSTASIIAAASQQFTATGTYSDGSTQNLTTSANWSSSNPSTATIGLHTGLAKGITAGSCTITAASGKISGSAALTVTAAVLTSITVKPARASVVAGKTEQFTATGTYNNGTTQNLTSSAIWTSSATSVATVSGGLATGVALGSATITATSATISGSGTLTVTAAMLTSIAVTPVDPSIALGTTLPMIATGTYSDGSTLVLTKSATWTTSNAAIATVSNQGVATGVALGSATVTATVGAISGSTVLTVSPTALVSIAVTPAIPVIALGATEQFTATGTYTDGSTQNITGTVQWSSATPSVATISNAAPKQGLATGVGPGSTTITATSGSISGSTTLTVTTAALVSIAVTPAAPSIALGTTEQFTATGAYTDGSTQNLTSTATWSSGTISTATINNTGLAQSVGVGTANITATSGTVSGSTPLTVTSATLVSIVITPQTATVGLGSTQQFTATGTFTDGSTQDLTRSGQWSSSAATVATISNTAGTNGLATTLSTGTTTIGVSSATITATATLVVTPASLVSIAISPLSPTIALGTTQQFTATGTYTDGSTQNLTSVVTWSSSLSTVAIISNAVGSNGLATSAGQGTSTISATSNSISSSTTITVGSAALVSIAITPASASISVGTTQQFAATGTYTDGTTQDLTSEANWSSSATAVATIAAGGLATGQAGGTATITATSGSITASATLSVVASSPLGQWAAPVYFCSNTPCVVGANAVLLNTGSVLFYYYPAAPGQGSQALLLDPITGAVTFVSLTISEDIFCSGVSILPNGNVLVTGGVVEGPHTTHVDNDGTYFTMLFNPSTSTWTAGQNMNYARWYPSSIEITDGTVLELSGSDQTGTVVQNTLESYDYTTGSWTILPSSANIPNPALQTYPRLSLLPSGNVFLSAPSAQTYQFNPSTNLWSFVANTNFGFRYFAPHVLLPGQEKIMVAGGSMNHAGGGGAATNTAEIIDMSAATPAWTYTGSMNYARYNENLVLLADGTVLAVGGGGGGGEYNNPVYSTELYNPTTAQWTLLASQTIQRTYHSTAVLLPDGRVLSSGSDNMALTEMTYEIYSPPYLFNGARPVIQSAPTSLTYGANFTITTSDASTITRVALVRPGATTHADNFDQRYVDLAFTLGSGTIQATAPPNGSEAPPGYYMLVIVNASGVPSVMPFLQLD
jgi:uncharacterized protein YjdB